uniref:Required for meiotic nuclear division 5-like protein B n=1 Tax=Rousettus aegyptiacus TaxID=9407 RepID=A0A7J8FLK6_ROUAE|nr:required for meiotic nuclear division 5-like protein B [Rousettus aegyptiacus]
MGVVRGSKNPPYPTVSPLAQVGPETVDPPLTQAEATIEHCVSVERQVDKVLQKFLTYGQHCKQSLEELGHVGQLWAELARTALQRTPLSATLSLVMSQCCQKIKDTVQKLASDPKDIHSSVSRVGKAIDRVGVWVPWAEVVMPGAGIHEAHQEGKCGKLWDSQAKQQQVLQVAIVEHLYQQGVLGVAEELCQVTARWAVSQRQHLLELNSPLEFQLPSTQYFRPFAWLHQQEIQVMMGSLVYLWLGLKKSPYCHLLDNSHWAKIYETIFDACSLLGLSMESPLSISRTLHHCGSCHSAFYSDRLWSLMLYSVW